MTGVASQYVSQRNGSCEIELWRLGIWRLLEFRHSEVRGAEVAPLSSAYPWHRHSICKIPIFGLHMYYTPGSQQLLVRSIWRGWLIQRRHWPACARYHATGVFVGSAIFLLLCTLQRLHLKALHLHLAPERLGGVVEDAEAVSGEVVPRVGQRHGRAELGEGLAVGAVRECRRP